MFDIADEWPVVAEDFEQWVIEDKFSNGRPNWERAGALFTDDVIPYEKMKLRLLNGSHSALAYLSYVHGHRRVDKATRDPIINQFITGYMEECTSTVPEVPGVDLTEYKAKLVSRFSNSQLSDQVSRLCEDGSKKMNVFVVPCILHKIESGASAAEMSHLSLAMAGWIRYLDGVD